MVTDRRIPHNRLDITIALRDKHQWLMVDVAVPHDRNIVTTKTSKRYQKLAFEVRQIHQVDVVLGGYRNARNSLEILCEVAGVLR